ncbi:ankyrin repeat and SAM domain-containing protein 1A-like isoform X2 [Zootermopsis nevadensis]|uniref:ankyrin repeat and SAM domain-containing protein 1A-like isoform X2 n=1 Tax=Zootermopsis nevadensis TaxID=136037 RepID=UPI000B8E2A34|nr:ankyrin repeat and SAM domain-containing protein 1A-like isoform X2 [Zootermopsis nevadensis]
MLPCSELLTSFFCLASPCQQEYKRRSRDIETEVEEELLLFPSLDASSGSLSSSVSLSDKSVSTDNNVEEFFGDAPFAGLFKGSTTPGPEGGSRSCPAERPKTLRRLKHVYDVAGPNGAICKAEDGGRSASCSRGSSGVTGPGIDKAQSLSILSPFDEQEEWAKISEIMASFGTGLVRESVFVSELEKEFQSRLGMTRSASSSPLAASGSTGGTSSVGQWLGGLGLADYESLLRNNGYDDLDFICGVLEDQDLKELGIDNEQDRKVILESAGSLPCKVHEQQSIGLNNNNAKSPTSAVGCGGRGDPEGQDDESGDESAVDRWLRSIRLDIYRDTFRKHLYTDMDRVRRIWEVELTAVLEIHRVGHRKRILASVSSQHPHGSHGPNLDDINADLNLLKSNIQLLKEEIREKLPVVPVTGTLRHNHKKCRPAPPPPTSANGSGVGSDLEIRAPSELLVGVPATLTTQWRHSPQDLVSGSVNYVANYLGSTVVKELRGTESTKKSIQKLKKSSTCTKDAKATPDIILAISYRGVKFLNTITKELVCGHEIRNIHCACQDADDLTHFAYITKDHASKGHYCHVFCVQTMDQATEVILTLGQAFEVAYQMALRDQVTGSRGPCHTRSQSASHILTTTNMPQPGTNSPGARSNHSRPHSINGQGQAKDASPNSKEVEDLPSGEESAETSKGNQVSQAPIVLTEEL